MSGAAPVLGVLAGVCAVANTIPYMPEGVHLAVVDPGVGSDRRALAVRDASGRIYVGPDNGLLAPAVAMAGGAERAVELTNRDYQLEAPGSTFAGRDIFAPAAAHVCNGVDLAELGHAAVVPSVADERGGGRRGDDGEGERKREGESAARRHGGTPVTAGGRRSGRNRGGP